MRLSVALDEYRFACLDLSPQTQRWYTDKLEPFRAWVEDQGTSELEEITPALVRRYLAHLRETTNPRSGKPLSTYTTHGYAQVIKGFLAWCAREELIPERVARRIDLPRVETKVIEIFTPIQIKRLFVVTGKEMTPALAARDKAILAVLLDTGIRASELCGLTLEHTHLTPTDAYLRVYGKGRKEREVGLGNESRAALHRYTARHRNAPEGERHVFLGRKHVPLTVSGLDQIIYRLSEWAGIEGVRCSAHTFRHTYAINYLAAGGDVYKLSRLLGHTGVGVTENYLRAFRSKDARKGPSVLDSLK